MVNRASFVTDYEEFWAKTPEQKDKADGHLVGLIFAMLAMGTQFVPFPPGKDKAQTAEFYGSCMFLWAWSVTDAFYKCLHLLRL